MRYALKANDGFYVKTYGPYGYELDHGPRWFKKSAEEIQAVCDNLNSRGDRQFEVVENE